MQARPRLILQGLEAGCVCHGCTGPQDLHHHTSSHASVKGEEKGSLRIRA